ncbi:type I 3-dehydroquinate dehydratase [Candidatus Bathyarchaeota archaeon]|nr:type I 3-dehydroquinate dehydratase [Candidatus Bathyarchaeota archaeon]MBT4320832.1 type I 3-dehydroquinate dehydratase [Candidatus Bathyarchaeota archaeon]MBT4423106.1 type I 3-dehydroquinate dehydratase [Candidatus Bathyarchaeota archaeon]MBT5642046.1 type I 3-dehydroquinate dehydratase [Candidatus Bathyarchaeota archaeon]MBT6605482.1 type I 3-dehydroquinate dehydratase [Candidatus Bathyarchaeota archaeon]
MRPWICVSIQSMTTRQTVDDVKRVGTEADLIEIRIDYRDEPLDFAEIVEASNAPLIGTNRREDQGGKAKETEEERVKTLTEAVKAGFTYIDLASTTENLENVVSDLKEEGAKVIASHHDFKHPLNIGQLEEKYAELKKTGCDVVKIIGWTDSVLDNLPYIKFNNEHPGNVSFGMGTKGVTSRIMAPLSGALFTYASLDEGKELGPGQVPLTHIREIYGRITK